MTDKTLRFKLGDREFDIPRLNLRQHREIDLTNADPVPDIKDGRASVADSYERFTRVILSALSVKYPEITREELDNIEIDEGPGQTTLAEVYTAIMKFAGRKMEKRQVGEAPAQPEAPAG
ncbi:MAG: hypothetical protein WAU56_07525 [Steroidobacteraceae bacterium]